MANKGLSQLPEIFKGKKIGNPALRAAYNELLKSRDEAFEAIVEKATEANQTVWDYNVKSADRLLSLGGVGERAKLDKDRFGYASVGEFCEFIGFGRGRAYGLMKWRRMLLSDAYSGAVKTLTWSMFAELSKDGITPAMLNEAFESGALSATSTQTELREWAKAHIPEDKRKAEVVTMLDCFTWNNGELVPTGETFTESEFYDSGECGAKLGGYEYIKLPKLTVEQGGKKLSYRRYLAIGATSITLYVGIPQVKREALPAPTHTEAEAIKLFCQLKRANMEDELALSIVSKQYPAVDMSTALDKFSETIKAVGNEITAE